MILSLFTQVSNYICFSNYQLPSRRKSAWRSCLDPCWDETLSLGCITRSFGDVGAATALTVSPAVTLPYLPEFFNDSTSIKTLPKLISIETAFDRKAPENWHNPVNGDKVQNLLWTIEQRKIVEESAVTITDTEDLKVKVSFHGLGIVCNWQVLYGAAIHVLRLRN